MKTRLGIREFCVAIGWCVLMGLVLGCGPTGVREKKSKSVSQAQMNDPGAVPQLSIRPLKSVRPCKSALLSECLPALRDLEIENLSEEPGILWVRARTDERVITTGYFGVYSPVSLSQLVFSKVSSLEGALTWKGYEIEQNALGQKREAEILHGEGWMRIELPPSSTTRLIATLQVIPGEGRCAEAYMERHLFGYRLEGRLKRELYITRAGVEEAEFVAALQKGRSAQDSEFQKTWGHSLIGGTSGVDLVTDLSFTYGAQPQDHRKDARVEPYGVCAWGVF